MIYRSLIYKLLPWGIFLITVNSHGQSLELGNTVFWWTVQLLVLTLFYLVKSKYSDKAHRKSLIILDIYLIYVTISFFRGAFIADGYWDWKSLISNTMCLFIPLLASSSDDTHLFKHSLNKYLYFTAPFFLFFQFFIGKDEFGFYLAPVSFVILFYPILPVKWKFICFVIALYVVFADLGARSNVVKFLIPFVFGSVYYLRKIITKGIMEFVRLILILLPVIFFTLAVQNIFNIFNPYGEKNDVILYTKQNFDGDIVEDDLSADTRTFIYIEVLNSAKLMDSWIFGRSPARGNLSDAFGDADMNNRNERNHNEVSILNYFTWLGLVGVVLIFLLFYQSSYLAINHSNNIFSKIIGLFVAFRWSYGWVEDINNFYIQYLYLWLFIGFCYSSSFRKMNDREMIDWVRCIFKPPVFVNTKK